MKSPWIKIGVGVLVALLSGIIGLLFHNAKKQQDFREAWEIDEATEEAQMFDDANEKAKVILHVEEAPTGADFKEMQMTQRMMLEKINDLAKIDTLNADQLYQIKEELKKNTNN